MMTHDEIIAVVQAHKKKKKLEWFSHKFVWETSVQESLEIILFNIIDNQILYRVAPEPPKPEYVPFENIEEFFQHRDKWLNLKGRGIVGKATTYGSGGITYNSQFVSWCQLYKDFEFDDGTPCGKLKE